MKNRIKRRVLPLLLAMAMIIGVVPVKTEAADAKAGNAFSIELKEPSYGTPNLYWNATVTGEGLYSGTLTIATGAYSNDNNLYSLNVTPVPKEGFVPGKVEKLTQGAVEFYGLKIGITAKNKEDIKNYLNENVTYNNPSGPWTVYKIPGITVGGYTSLTGTFSPNQYQPPVEEKVTVSLNMEGEDPKGGKVTVDGTELTAAGLEIKKGSTPEVVFTPSKDYYVSGYKIGNTETQTKGEGAKTITLTAAQTSADVVIAPAFTKVEKETSIPQNPTTPGNLSWTGGEKATLSYKDALTYNFNVTAGSAKARLLNSNFGKSWTFGVDLLDNPKMYATASFNGGKAIEVGKENAMKDLGKLGGQDGKVPAANGEPLDVAITVDHIVPGTFTQTAYVTYYTASTICGAHWYHVGGVQSHNDMIERTIEIEKDVLALSGVETSYPYAENVLDTIKGDATLTPASAGTAGSKAVVDEKKVSFEIKDEAGKEVTEITKAGTYTVVVKYAGDDYIQAFTSKPVTVEVTRIDRPEAERDVQIPMVMSTTATSFELRGIVEKQQYMIEGVTDGWVDGADIEKFVDLTPNTTYVIQTKLPATDIYNEILGENVEVTTLSVLYGKVTSDFKPEDLPATLTISYVSEDGAVGDTFYVETKEDGTYRVEIPASICTVSAVGKDGYQAFEPEEEGSFEVAGETEFNFTMTDTAKGKAKKFIDEHKIDEGKKPITGISEEIIKLILESEDDYNQLPEDVKDEIDKLLAPDTYKGILDKVKKHVDEMEKLAAEKAEKEKADKEKKAGAVKTGDEANVAPYMFLTLASVLAIVAVVFRKKYTDR